MKNFLQSDMRRNRRAATFGLALSASMIFTLIACDTRPPLDAQDLSRPPILELSVASQSLLSDKDTFLVVKATLVTAAHGTLSGKGLSFTAQIGYVNALATTNDSGQATIFYYNRPQNLSVERSDTVVGTFKYGDGEYIRDTLEIRLLPGKATTGEAVGSVELSTSRTGVQVKGTGNNDQAIIRAHVFDINRIAVRDGTPVTFTIVRGPGGGEVLTGASQTEVATTQKGIASVTFHSGTAIGVVEIQAASGGQNTRQALLTVTSGPPQHINIVARQDSANPAGNRWRMIVQAQLTDAYLNPVKDSLGVLFSVKPKRSDLGAVSIAGSGFTGNKLCEECDSVPGSAFTSVTYRSEAVFDTLVVTAETSTPAGLLTGSQPFQLPLQRPVLRANYYGGSVYAPSIEPEDTLQIHGDLLDGFGWKVVGAKICMASDGGTLLNQCQITDALGHVTFDMTVTSRDQVTVAASRIINIKLVEQSTGAGAITTFTAVFR